MNGRSIKRLVVLVFVLLSVTLWAASRFAVGRRAQAQTVAQTAQQSAQTVSPNPGGSVAAQDPVYGRNINPLDCRGCHATGQPLPYLGGARFHREAWAAYEQSAHGRAAAEGRKAAACLDCHSPDGRPENILPYTDANSSANRRNLGQTCGKCHAAPAGGFHESIHGRGQARGINVAASCADCHGAHNILHASDPRSLLSRANTPSTCAKCHSSVLADFQTSAHGHALARGDERAPVCTTCHTSVSHAPAPAGTREFNMDAIATCGKCHEKQAPSYRDTFHGQATALGFRPAATCADCHTPHKNLPPEDAHSSVSRANLVETCSRCHQGANANFVAYDPHPEPKDPGRSTLVYVTYNFMSLLFVGVFGFFGLHTLLWLQRSVVGVLRGEARRHRDGEQWVMRFSKSNRYTHVAIVVSFLVLAATGLPLMYYYTGWGQSLARGLGGVGVTRLLHRVFAVVTFGYAFYHLGYLLYLYFVKRQKGLLWGPDSMMPRWKDWADLKRMVRWFLYLDKRPPRLDRWTYWEKFDYFAVFWGIPVIGLSGLMLWIPGFFSRVLPGSVLNVAMIVHGEEALLATGFIFAFHFFHNHLRPENFPLDTVIFTGKLPLERFRHERPREFKRLRKEGRLEEILTGPPTPRQRLFASLFGYTAYFIGLVLVVAIFYSLIFFRH